MQKDDRTDLLRILIVEDSAEDALLILRELSREFKVTSERVAAAPTMKAALETQLWDIVISDYSIPGFGGPEALVLFKKSELDIPFIMVSGVMGEALAVEMLKLGAHNYVLKHQLHRLVPAVRLELRAAGERRSQRQNQAAAAYMASVVASCEEAIISTNLEGTVISWNAGAERLFGYRPSEIIGRSCSALVSSFRPDDWSEMLPRIGQGGHVESRETQWLRKDGTRVDLMMTISPVRADNQRVMGASIVAHDITRCKLDEADRLILIQELTAALAHLNNGNGRTQPSALALSTSPK